MLAVTGATGFLGTNLICHASPDLECVAITRKGSSTTSSATVVWDGKVDGLWRNLDRFPITGIVHLAAHYVADATPSDLQPLVDVSVSLSMAIYEYAAKQGLPVVTATSRFVGLPSRSPINTYALFKSFQETSTRYFSDRGLQACLLEIGDLYGEGDTREKFIDKAIRATLRGEEVQLANPDNFLYPIHVSDAVRAALSSLREGTTSPAQLYSITGPEGAVTTREVLFQIRDLVDLPAPARELHPRPLRCIDARINSYSPRGKEPSGWSAEVSLRTGLNRLISNWNREAPQV